jgi:hypothetical protein
LSRAPVTEARHTTQHHGLWGYGRWMGGRGCTVPPPASYRKKYRTQSACRCRCCCRRPGGSLHARDGTPNQVWPAQASLALLVLVLVSHGKTRSYKCQRVSAVQTTRASKSQSGSVLCSSSPLQRAPIYAGLSRQNVGQRQHATHAPLTSCSEHSCRRAQNMLGRCLLPRPSLAIGTCMQ